LQFIAGYHIDSTGLGLRLAPTFDEGKRSVVPPFLFLYNTHSFGTQFWTRFLRRVLKPEGFHPG
jgi:hypothetical protein